MNIKCKYTYLPYDEFRKHADASRETLKRVGGISGLHLIENPQEELHMAFCKDCRDHLGSLDPKNRN